MLCDKQDRPTLMSFTFALSFYTLLCLCAVLFFAPLFYIAKISYSYKSDDNIYTPVKGTANVFAL